MQDSARIIPFPRQSPDHQTWKMSRLIDSFRAAQATTIAARYHAKLALSEYVDAHSSLRASIRALRSEESRLRSLSEDLLGLDQNPPAA